jgi:hypothetical protein
MFAVTMALVALAALPAQAQPQWHPPVQSPADQAELDSFRLSDDTLLRLVATAYDMNKAHVPLRLSGDLSVTDLSQSLAGSPDATAILDKHGFTPHSFAITFTAAASAALVVMAKKIRLPSMAKGVHVSPEEIDFYKAHRDQIDKVLGVPSL